MRFTKIVFAQLGIVTAAVIGGVAVSGAAQAEKAVSFSADVKPIIDEHCVMCHVPPDGEGYQASGLDLTSYEGLMKGTKFGPVIVPGDGTLSNMLRLMEGQAAPGISMPHGKGKIPKKERNVLRRWINQGALDN